MTFDANEHRRESLSGWEEAASGWVRRAETIRALGRSRFRLDARRGRPAAGQRVLEWRPDWARRNAGGRTGGAEGGVAISDQAEAMLAGARQRAHELELGNIEFQVLNAEWIDLPVASVDAVLCRWGYMLMADPAAALGRPGACCAGRAGGARGLGRNRAQPVGRAARRRARRAGPDRAWRGPWRPARSGSAIRAPEGDGRGGGLLGHRSSSRSEC